MRNWGERTALLVGEETMLEWQNAHVLVVGVGGVGAFAAEFLARAGIGCMTLVDGDRISETNRNRQLPALISTEGEYKVNVLSDRLRDINPDLHVQEYPIFLKASEIPALILGDHPFAVTLGKYDAVVDAIDSVGPKVSLLHYCVQQGIPVISAMGAAGKLRPDLVQQCDISKTHQCPLAKSVRSRLHDLGVNKGVPVVFSPEIIDKSRLFHDSESGKSVPGSISYLPAVFGAQMAAYVLQTLSEKSK